MGAELESPKAKGERRKLAVRGKHVDDDPWEEWYKFYKYRDDRKGDDDRRDDDRKDCVDEQWTGQGDDWKDQWKHCL